MIGNGVMAAEEKQISLKRWDRYSASYTTNEDKNHIEKRLAKLKVIKGNEGQGNQVQGRFSK